MQLEVLSISFCWDSAVKSCLLHTWTIFPLYEMWMQAWSKKNTAIAKEWIHQNVPWEIPTKKWRRRILRCSPLPCVSHSPETQGQLHSMLLNAANQWKQWKQIVPECNQIVNCFRVTFSLRPLASEPALRSHHASGNHGTMLYHGNCHGMCPTGPTATLMSLAPGLAVARAQSMLCSWDAEDFWSGSSQSPEWNTHNLAQCSKSIKSLPGSFLS